MNRTHITYRGEEVLSQIEIDVTWEQVRRERDQALDDSDWRAVKDRTMSQAWKDYRQALRDITEHPDANTAADHWPEAPE